MDGVSLITTVRNEAASVEAFLDSMLAQTRPPDEIVIVDGGSTDGTIEAVQRRIDASGAPPSPFQGDPSGTGGSEGCGPSSRPERAPHAALSQRGRGEVAGEGGRATIRLIVQPGANIARGRNLAIAAARFDLIAATDAGCRIAPDWLEHLVRPLREDPTVDVVGGFYRIDPRSFFERVNGLLTLPGQLEPVDPERFLPSGRSVAFRKRAWAAAGGYPEWLYAAEDSLFDRKLKAMGCRFVFQPQAVVYWRPRETLRRFARQFYVYGMGSGRVGGFSSGYWYTIRQHLITALLVALAIMRPIAWVAAGLWTLYYVLFSALPQARLVARQMGSARAGFLALCLIEVRRLAGAAGFLVGTIQRSCRPGRYKRLQNQYFGRYAAPRDRPGSAATPGLPSD